MMLGQMPSSEGPTDGHSSGTPCASSQLTAFGAGVISTLIGPAEAAALGTAATGATGAAGAGARPNGSRSQPATLAANEPAMNKNLVRSIIIEFLKAQQRGPAWCQWDCKPRACRI